MSERDLKMLYLGVLGILSECSVLLPNSPEGEDLRDSIMDAFDDACRRYPSLRWKRTLSRINIEVDI